MKETRKIGKMVVALAIVLLAAAGLFLPLEAPEERLREKIAIDARDNVFLWNGADLYMYSDDHSTQKLHFDGATGTITLANSETIGNTTDTVIDVSAFFAFSEASVVVVTAGATITPVGSYQPITSTAAVTTGTSTAIANGVKNGQLLVLVNENASDAIVIDDGANTNLGGNKTLTGGEGDAIWLFWDGSDWLCIGYNDN